MCSKNRSLFHSPSVHRMFRSSNTNPLRRRLQLLIFYNYDSLAFLLTDYYTARQQSVLQPSVFSALNVANVKLN